MDKDKAIKDMRHFLQTCRSNLKLAETLLNNIRDYNDSEFDDSFKIILNKINDSLNLYKEIKQYIKNS